MRRTGRTQACPAGAGRQLRGAVPRGAASGPLPAELAREGRGEDRLGNSRLEGAIGVIYRPETERASHYFHARLPQQFDAILHFDETRALEPLEGTAEWEKGEFPETCPFAV